MKDGKQSSNWKYWLPTSCYKTYEEEEWHNGPFNFKIVNKTGKMTITLEGESIDDKTKRCIGDSILVEA
ncbi:hypothetical protein FRX31_009337 [Thalictrum thalictroides]|uniref:Uncharacterized protein n=1 Tax=Thalictrum thalictroides TaxID=46969 RepID=A0A7J6WVY9_THATH|nr:hypothetical protein FRX31_009337 [Thalictrum thalictroides]